MTENPTPPKQRGILTGVLAALALAVIAAAAFAVVWIVVLDATPGPDRVGDDAQQAQVEPTLTPVVRTGTQQQEETASGSTPSPQQDILIVPQEVKLIDIIPSPRIVTLNGPGQSQRLTVQGFYSDGSKGDLVPDPGEEFRYASSDTSVVEVTSEGVISSLKAGGTDVTVSYGAFESEVPVLVWGEVRQIPPIDPDRLLPIDEDGTAIVLNRVMARLVQGNDIEQAKEIANKVSGEVLHAYRNFPGFVIGIEASTIEELEQSLLILRADPRILHVYPDMVAAGSQDESLNWQIDTMVAAEGVKQSYLSVGMDNAWRVMNSTPSLRPIIIAVVDNGFPQNNPHNSKIDRELPLVEQGGRIKLFDVVPGGAIYHHGASVTSVIAAKNNNEMDSIVDIENFSGVVSSVKHLEFELIFYDVAEPGIEGGWSHTGILNALDQINDYRPKVDIVNLSFDDRISEECTDFCEDLRLSLDEMDDIVFVVAGGNFKHDDGPEVEFREECLNPPNARNLDVCPRIPSMFAAELENVLAIAGTEKLLNGDPILTPASLHGSSILMGSPYYVWAISRTKDDYGREGGTSYAAPMVTGTVAMMLSLSSERLRDEINDLPKTIKIGLVGSSSYYDTLCRFGEPSCEGDGRLPFLNAGQAISNLMDIRGEIPWQSSSDIKRTLPLPGYVELIFPIKNTGSHTLLFQLEGTAVSDGGRKLFKTERIYVPPGGINAFDATFRVDGEGELEISLELHNVFDFVSPRDTNSRPLDTMTFTLSVTEEIPTRPHATATVTPVPRRTVVPTSSATSAVATRPAVQPPAPAFAHGTETPPIASPTTATMPTPVEVPVAFN